MADPYCLPGTHPPHPAAVTMVTFPSCMLQKNKKWPGSKSPHPRRCIAHRGGGIATMLKLMPWTGFLTRYAPSDGVMLSGGTTAYAESKTRTKPQVE